MASVDPAASARDLAQRGHDPMGRPGPMADSGLWPTRPYGDSGA